jgi:hypothetical protein
MAILLFCSVTIFAQLAGASISNVAAVSAVCRVVQDAQDEGQEDERKVWDEGLLKKRRAPNRPAPQRTYSYRRVPSRLSVLARKRNRAPKGVSSGDERVQRANGLPTPELSATSTAWRVIGVTFWRLRPSSPKDEARLLIHDREGARSGEWTPERIEAETPLKVGDRVRISVESPTTGYLYVIDREMYSDGSMSEPYLIFPTRRTRGGDNRVTAGRLIEIPAQDDDPSYLSVRPRQPDQQAELLTFIITDQPLGVEIGRDLIKLREAQVSDWEDKWEAPFFRSEQVKGKGKAYTRAEQEAGRDEKRLLTQDEPMPQTIYKIYSQPGNPLLISIPLFYDFKAGADK